MKRTFIPARVKQVAKSLQKRITESRELRAKISKVTDTQTTTVERPTRRTYRHLPWRTLYGWNLDAIATPGAMLDSDGKPTRFSLIKRFSAKVGDVVEGQSRGKYIVAPDHSLRSIV